MSKAEFINFVISKNYRYEETTEEINIYKITDELGNFDESITFTKEDKSIQIWLDKNGSGKAHTLDETETQIIKYLSEV